mgnify:FL=1|tara:strand:- start:638 stop:1453 length:816 start_codon:yes stop_codon:yes gene_type:complete
MATAKPKPRATASVPTAAPAVPKAKSSYKVKQSYNADTTKVYEIVRGGGIICKIKSEVTIYSEERGGIQAIRYCPNEPSIFRAEQSEYARREHVMFRDKLLMVPKTKPNLQEFLDNHPDNAANGGGVFKLIDKNASAEELLEKEFSQHEAVSLVRDKSVDELLPVAMYLDVNINQRNAEIKRELLIEAKSNPTKFIQLFDNPQVKCRSAVMQAVDFQILNSKQDGMYWYDTNRLIVSAPVGTQAIEVATRFFMTEKGATAYERVLEQLEKI